MFYGHLVVGDYDEGVDGEVRLGAVDDGVVLMEWKSVRFGVLRLTTRNNLLSFNSRQVLKLFGQKF